MAGEYSPHGVRVNAIAPGTVDTTMTRNTGPEAMARMSDLSHIGRIGHPDELVGAALLLASDAGSYITGQMHHRRRRLRACEIELRRR